MSADKVLDDNPRCSVPDGTYRGVWKIQKPLRTNDPDPKFMIYNAGHEIVTYMDMDPEHQVSRIMKDCYKRYVVGHLKVSKDGNKGEFFVKRILSERDHRCNF